MNYPIEKTEQFSVLGTDFCEAWFKILKIRIDPKNIHRFI
jgi:hypothetical protein